MHVLHDVRQNAAAQAQATSTGTANVQTLAAPAGAIGCVLQAETTNARVSFNGVDPSAANGLIIYAGVSPVYFAFAETIKIASAVAGTSLLDVLWLY